MSRIGGIEVIDYYGDVYLLKQFCHNYIKIHKNVFEGNENIYKVELGNRYTSGETIIFLDKKYIVELYELFEMEELVSN